MKLYIGILVLLFMSSCKVENTVNTTTDADLEKVKNPRTMEIKAFIGDKDPVNSANFIVNDLSITGNMMTLEISYLGGCAEHSFKMIGLPISASSIQAIRNVQLIHFSDNDKCTDEKKVTLKVDISDLAAQKEDGKKTVLVLDSWKNKIEYIYTLKQ